MATVAAGQRRAGRREPGRYGQDGATIGFVLPMRAVIFRGLGQSGEFGRTTDQHLGHRQFGAKMLQLAEVIVESRLALSPHGDVESLPVHVGVAVPVTPDPIAHAEERGCRLAEEMFHFGVEARDLAQEGRAVVAQGILDLVAYRQLAVAQQARLPELRDPGSQHGGVSRQLPLLDQALSHRQEFGDGEFGVEQALALHLRRMRGQHGRHPRLLQRFRDLLLRDTRFREALEGPGQAAFLVHDRTGLVCVERAPAHPVTVLGDIRQVREIREGADHRDGLRRRHAAEQQFERMTGRDVGVALVTHAQPADVFHQGETALAVVLADDVAQHRAQQADVVDQRLILGRVPACGGLNRCVH